jgi:hypothetical protein
MVGKLLIAGVILTLGSPVLAGTISMSSTPYPDSVVVTVTITDTGGAAECGWLAITRNGADVFFYIPREIGSTITRRFADTAVERNTLYCYEMALRAAPAPVPCAGDDLCDVFDCSYQIMTCVNTGPDPAFIGHGLLSTRFPDGTPVDGNEAQALLYSCTSTSDFRGLHTIPAEAAPYVDTGNGVDVYGTWWCCWAQGVWLLAAEAVTPHSCTVAVEETTWGRMKSLFRD